MRRYSLPLCALLLAVPLLAARTEPVRVTAKKGAVELALLVESTHLNTGQIPAIRLELKNIGRKRFAVANDVFTDAGKLRENWSTRSGTFIEILGPGDAKIRPDLRWEDRSTATEFPCPEAKKAAQDQIAAWKQEGRSDAAIDALLIAWKSPSCPKDRHIQPAVIIVAPGASLHFPERKGSSFSALSDFGTGFRLPGAYKIRAVYDMEPDKGMAANYAKGLGRREPNEVTLRTEWVSLEFR